MSVSNGLIMYMYSLIDEKLTCVYFFRLTCIPFVSSKLSKITKTSNSAEENNLFSGEPSQEIFACLHLADNNIADKVTFDLLNSYPSIFISEAVQRSLNLEMNSKVKLDIITNGKFGNKVTEINYNVLNSEVSQFST